MGDTTLLTGQSAVIICGKMKDITGQKFGSLTAKFPYKGACNKVYWHCICACDNTVGLTATILLAGKRDTCGKGKCNPAVIDITGQKFDRLTAVSYADGKWRCECSCGSSKTTYARHCDLQSGIRKSCGCITNAVSGESAAFNIVYHTYKDSASRRGLVFDLPRSTFDTLIRYKCHYCGDPPRSRPIEIQYKAAHPEPVHIAYTGIDRKNPSIGYTVDNCVSCCTADNRAKGDMLYDDYLEWSHQKMAFILSSTDYKEAGNI